MQDISSGGGRARPHVDGAASVEARTVLEGLARIERRLDAVEALARGARRDAEGAIGGAVDTLDGLVARMQQAEIDPDERLRNLLTVAEALSSARAVALIDASLSRADAIRAVLESGVLDPGAVAIVSKAGRALADAARDEGPGLGALGLVRAIGDADVRAASGLLVRFARRLGRALGPSARPALPAESGTARGGAAEEVTR
jgi:hypothetical protein